MQESDFDPVDNCLASVLGQDVELTDEFKANYQTWLQREVYNTEIQWELLLEDVEIPQKSIYYLKNPKWTPKYLANSIYNRKVSS